MVKQRLSYTSALYTLSWYPQGHSYDVGLPRVVYDLTWRSFILRSLYKQKSVLL